MALRGPLPRAEPGSWDGTAGDWWTVFAASPDILDHCVKGFGLYQSPDRKLEPKLRELGQIRAGWAAGSQFVFSQHAKSMRGLDMPEAQITHIPAWSVAPEGTYDPAERAVLAYTDCLVYDHGRVPDALFEELQRHLDELAILELTYITTLYFQHAVMSKALRTEWTTATIPSSRFRVLRCFRHASRAESMTAGTSSAGRRTASRPGRRGAVERVVLLRLRPGRRLLRRLAPARPVPEPPGGVVDGLDRVARSPRPLLSRLPRPGRPATAWSRRRPSVPTTQPPWIAIELARPLESFRLAASATARFIVPAEAFYA